MTAVPQGDRPGVVWTGSGLLDLCDIDPAAIHLRDVSRNLSRLPRFGGATVKPWSVLQHSLLVWRLAERDGAPAEDQLAALLHDAPEYLLGDMMSPLKAICPDYRVIEARLTLAVRARFGLALRSDWSEVKGWDRAAYEAERALRVRANAWAPAPRDPMPGTNADMEWLAGLPAEALRDLFEGLVESRRRRPRA